MEMANQSQIEIVKLQPSEWQVYKTLRLRGLKEDPQAFGSNFEKESQWPDEKWQERLASSKQLIFAKMDGQVVGMIGAYQRDTDKVASSAEIWGVYVVAEARGKGISSRLMEELLKILKEDGLVLVHLGVNRDQPSAVGLYKKFGFAQTGEQKIVMGDGIEHSELLMAKQL